MTSNASYVCPTGVDIRNGPNLGCIQCGLCSMPATPVMARTGRPARLIAYDTDINIHLPAGRQDAPSYKILRLRTARSTPLSSPSLAA